MEGIKSACWATDPEIPVDPVPEERREFQGLRRPLELWKVRA